MQSLAFFSSKVVKVAFISILALLVVVSLSIRYAKSSSNSFPANKELPRMVSVPKEEIALLPLDEAKAWANSKGIRLFLANSSSGKLLDITTERDVQSSVIFRFEGGLELGVEDRSSQFNMNYKAYIEAKSKTREAPLDVWPSTVWQLTKVRGYPGMVREPGFVWIRDDKGNPLKSNELISGMVVWSDPEAKAEYRLSKPDTPASELLKIAESLTPVE